MVDLHAGTPIIQRIFEITRPAAIIALRKCRPDTVLDPKLFPPFKFMIKGLGGEDIVVPGMDVSLLSQLQSTYRIRWKGLADSMIERNSKDQEQMLELNTTVLDCSRTHQNQGCREDMLHTARHADSIYTLVSS